MLKMIVIKRMNRAIRNMSDTRQESTCRMIEKLKYSPKSTQIKLLPQRQNPTATRTILITQLMLIGSKVNRCFLFFSMLSIIFDIFFYAVSEPVGVIAFQWLKEGSCLAADKFFAIKYNP